MPETGLHQELAALRRENQALKAKLACQEELLHERAQLIEAIEALPDGLVLFDAEEQLIICNGKYRELHPAVAEIMVPGTRFETIVQEAAARGQHPDADGRVEEWKRERLAAYRDPGEPIEQQFFDGSWRRVYERRTADGGTVGVRIDITELKARERDLRSSEARLRDYLEASSDWFWEMDAQCRFSYFSESFEALTGVAPEILLGKTREETGIPGVDPRQWSDHLANLSAHRSFRDFRHPRTLPDGRQVYLSISGKAVFDEDNQFIGYRGTGHDVTALVMAELSAWGSELRLANAIESLSEYFVLWGKDDRLVLCNEKFRELNAEIVAFTTSGTRLEDYFRAGIAKGLYPESEGREEEWLAEVIRVHHEPREPLEVRRKDGRWLLVHGQRMPDGGFVRTGTDITAQKQAEAALQVAHDDLEKRVKQRTAELHQTNSKLQREISERETAQQKLRASRALLEAMLDNFPDLTGLRDTEGRYILVNRTFEDWYAISRSRILGKKAYEFWPEEAAEEFKRRDDEAITNRKAIVRHMDIEYPDGKTRSVRTLRFPVFVDGTTLLGVGFINSDVTDLMQAQREATEKSALMQTVLDAIPANISLRDTEARYQFANRHLANGVGLPAQAFVGKTGNELFPDRDGANADEMACQVIETGKPILNHELQLRHPSESTILTNVVPTYRSDGTLSGTVGIGFNITEPKKLEEQLRQSQKMEAVGQLTGGVAHDFNNLLGVIIGNLELLEEQLDDLQGEGKEMLDAAMEAVQKGANLNRQLLAFSRRQALAPRSIDLNEQIMGMVSMLRRTLGETIKVDVASTAGLWSCNADPAQVEAALLNLSINARDAMPNGGKLTVELSNEILTEHDISDISDVEPGQYVSLAVRDTGQGIQQDALNHVFEPFYTTKEVGEGSGLGLSMVFGFAKQSRGHVAIDSKEGIGTTVTLYLPRADAATEAVSEIEPEAPSAQGETVLVVEDDQDMRNLTEKLVRDLGYRPLVASDGKSAFAEMSRSERIDILLTDIVLPGGMDGSKIAAEAKSRFADIKVLFMSGYTRNHLADQGGLDDSVLLLEKPFRKFELARKLREAIEA